MTAPKLALLTFLEAVYWAQQDLPIDVPAQPDAPATNSLPTAAFHRLTSQAQLSRSLQRAQHLATGAISLAHALQATALRAAVIGGLPPPTLAQDEAGSDSDPAGPVATQQAERVRALRAVQASVQAELVVLEALHRLLSDRGVTALPPLPECTSPAPFAAASRHPGVGVAPGDDAAAGPALDSHAPSGAVVLLERAKASRAALEALRARMAPELGEAGDVSDESDDEVRLDCSYREVHPGACELPCNAVLNCNSTAANTTPRRLLHHHARQQATYLGKPTHLTLNAMNPNAQCTAPQYSVGHV